MVEEIVVNNRKYTLSEFHGEVVDQQVSATSFSSGSSHRNEYGQHVSSNVSGTRTTKEFFLVNKEGEERAYSFTNLSIPSIRPSHLAQVMYLRKEGAKEYRLVLVRNVTLNTDYLLEKEIEQLCLDSKNVILELALVAFGVFFIFVSFCLFVVALFLEGGFGILVLAIIAAAIATYVIRSGNNRFSKQEQLIKATILNKRK